MSATALQLSLLQEPPLSEVRQRPGHCLVASPTAFIAAHSLLPRHLYPARRVTGHCSQPSETDLQSIVLRCLTGFAQAGAGSPFHWWPHRDGGRAPHLDSGIALSSSCALHRHRRWLESGATLVGCT